MKKSRIGYEKRVVSHMIEIYCHAHHGKDGLCKECSVLQEYAHSRLDHCRFGESKPSCQKCPIHCYNPQMRERIREVMRYSGPRMLWFHPVEAIAHICQQCRGLSRA